MYGRIVASGAALAIALLFFSQQGSTTRATGRTPQAPFYITIFASLRESSKEDEGGWKEGGKRCLSVVEQRRRRLCAYPWLYHSQRLVRSRLVFYFLLFSYASRRLWREGMEGDTGWWRGRGGRRQDKQRRTRLAMRQGPNRCVGRVRSSGPHTVINLLASFVSDIFGPLAPTRAPTLLPALTSQLHTHHERCTFNCAVRHAGQPSLKGGVCGIGRRGVSQLRTRIALRSLLSVMDEQTQTSFGPELVRRMLGHCSSGLKWWHVGLQRFHLAVGVALDGELDKVIMVVGRARHGKRIDACSPSGERRHKAGHSLPDFAVRLGNYPACLAAGILFLAFVVMWGFVANRLKEEQRGHLSWLKLRTTHIHSVVLCGPGRSSLASSLVALSHDFGTALEAMWAEMLFKPGLASARCHALFWVCLGGQL